MLNGEQPALNPGDTARLGEFDPLHLRLWEVKSAWADHGLEYRRCCKAFGSSPALPALENEAGVGWSLLRKQRAPQGVRVGSDVLRLGRKHCWGCSGLLIRRAGFNSLSAHLLLLHQRSVPQPFKL
jgi:hypothetical protein